MNFTLKSHLQLSFTIVFLISYDNKTQLYNTNFNDNYKIICVIIPYIDINVYV